MIEHSMHVFYTTAKRYCRFLREWVIDPRSTPELIAILMDLYLYAMKLPSGDAIVPEESDKGSEKADLGEGMPFASRVKFDPGYPSLYYGRLDPFDDSRKNIQLSLAVDLGDIYDDLEPGIIMYENDKKAWATSAWKKDFELHWGRHAVNAIRVLHEYITNTEYLCSLNENE